MDGASPNSRRSVNCLPSPGRADFRIGCSSSSEDSCSEASVETAIASNGLPESAQTSAATLVSRDYMDSAQRPSTLPNSSDPPVDADHLVRHCSRQQLSSDLRALLRDQSEVAFSTIVRKCDGLTLNQYCIDATSAVANGRFGTVQRAHTADGAAYALKVVKKSKIQQYRRWMRKSSNGTDSVTREVSALRRLNHRNIVRLVEVIDDPDDDNLYLVFMFCEHGSLMTLPCDKPLSERRAWRHFRDVVDGLEYLHAQSIVHRDLKPENLLLDGEGRIQIADFGSAREFSGDDDTMLNAVGTPAFWPPEQLQEEVCGERAPSGRAMDLWALGVTLFALVYGRVPFSALHVERLAEAIRKDKLVFPAEPKISSALRDLLERLLDKDPARRIDMAGIRRHAWLESVA